jgi:hypothetical protein
MTECSVTERDMAWENELTWMAVNIQENTLMTSLMGRVSVTIPNYFIQVYIFGKTVKGMKVNGRTVSSMVRESRPYLMELFSMETGRKGDLSGKDFASIRMVQSILAVG